MTRQRLAERVGEVQSSKKRDPLSFITNIPFMPPTGTVAALQHTCHILATLNVTFIAMKADEA
jgi:hypothetical protein